MPILALVLILIALALLWQASRQRKSAGLPGGRVVYADTSRWSPLSKPLYAADLGLTGKPDYLIEQGETIIPVEVKTAHRVQAPFDTHVYQLAAYCVLVEQTFGRRPPYGVLHYTDGKGHNQTYAIDFTPELESAVLALVQEIQRCPTRQPPNRSHELPARCAHCGFRSTCDQALS